MRGPLSHPRIGILSCAGDLHSLIIQEALRQLDCACDIVETDHISGSVGITWELQSSLCRLPTSEGAVIDLQDLHAIWLRRINYPQVLKQFERDSISASIVNNDCKTALLGALFTTFGGTWIDDPLCIQRAENKLLQLQFAKAAGFRTPNTLVSQDVDRIRTFCSAQPQGAIVKTIRGISTFPLMALKVSEEMLDEADSLSISPACYQEYIPGDRHIRVNCFGEDVYAFEIESSDLDWRQNLDVPFSKFTVSRDLRSRLRYVLRAFDLTMGVFDLKLDPEGEPVWLEINPQGQFLFVEGLTGFDLTTPFVQFLLRSV